MEKDEQDKNDFRKMIINLQMEAKDENQKDTLRKKEIPPVFDSDRGFGRLPDIIKMKIKDYKEEIQAKIKDLNQMTNRSEELEAKLNHLMKQLDVLKKNNECDIGEAERLAKLK